MGVNHRGITAHDRLQRSLRRSEQVAKDRQRVVSAMQYRFHHRASHVFAKGVTRTPPDPPPQSIDQNHQCALFATHGTFGVLDLGASKTAVGSDNVVSILQGLDEAIRKRVTRVKCQITFKFGNSGTLQSTDAMVIPIGPLKLKVAIVPGSTPFLASNTLMRAIQANINCKTHH